MAKIQIVSDSRCQRALVCAPCENQIVYALEVEQLKEEDGKRGTFVGRWRKRSVCRRGREGDVSDYIIKLKIQYKNCALRISDAGSARRPPFAFAD